MTVMEAFRAAARYSGGDLRRGVLWAILPTALFWFVQGPGYGLAVGVVITLSVYMIRVGKNASAHRHVAQRRAYYESIGFYD
jgi:hypothetical protein